MAHVNWYASRETVIGARVRLRWLRVMYAANVAVSGPIGLASLAAPAATRGLLGIPTGDPVGFGIANGAVPLAFALAGLAGLRAPLRLSPVLALQAAYKLLFLVGVAVPLAAAGALPAHAAPVIGIFVGFVVGDLIAVPFSYLRSTPSRPA